MSEQARPGGRPVVILDIPLTDAPARTVRRSGASRTDTTPVREPDISVTPPSAVRPLPADAAPSAPALVRPDVSVSAFAEPSVQWTVMAPPEPDPVRHAPRAPQRTARWPFVVGFVVIPAAGGTGFLAAAFSSAAPIQILTYTVVGGVVIWKVAGPVRAVVAAIGSAIAKVPR